MIVRSAYTHDRACRPSLEDRIGQARLCDILTGVESQCVKDAEKLDAQRMMT